MINTDKIKFSNTSISLMLVALALIVYWPIQHFDYIFLDDTTAIFDNPHVKNGLNLNSIKWAFTTTFYDYWHPLTWITHMVEWSVFNRNASGYHIVNLLIHIANTLLLFNFIRLLTKSRVKGAFVASIFAIHPMHIESVVWIVERKDVLSMLFALSTLLSYTASGKEKSTSKYILALLFYILALMTKPMFVTLPFILVLVDLLKKSINLSDLKNLSVLRMLILNKIPFILLALISSVLTFTVVNSSGATVSMDFIKIPTRIMNTVMSYYTFTIDLFFPFNMAIYHPYNELLTIKDIITPLFVLITITAVCLFSYKKNKEYLLGWIWFLFSLLPVIGIVQAGNQAYADRFVYFPYIGLYIALAAVFSKTGRMKSIILILLIGYLSVINRSYSKHWKNSESLFKHALARNSNSSLINNNLGYYYNTKGELDSALKYYSNAIKCYSSYSMAYYNKGTIFEDMGIYDSAYAYFRVALDCDSTNIKAYCSLARLYKQANKSDSMVQYYSLKAYSLDSNSVQVCNLLGDINMSKNRYVEAIKYLNRSLSIDNKQWNIVNNVGICYLQLNKLDSSYIYFLRASELNRNQKLPLINMTIILKRKKKYDALLALCNYAIKKFPNEAKFYMFKGEILYNYKEYSKAKHFLEKAKHLDTAIVNFQKEGVN